MPRPRLKANSGLPRRWRLKNGAYRYQVPKGERDRWDGKAEFTLGKTLPDAYKVWAERIGPLPESEMVGELLDRYVLEVTPKKKPATQRTDRRIAPILKKRFAQFTVKPGPQGVKPHHIYEYVSKRGALTRGHREMAMLSHAFSFAVQLGLIDKHPFKGEVRFEKELQPKGVRTRYVENWEIAEALSLVPYRKRGSVLMCQAYLRLKLADTGLRETDMLRLKVSDATAEGFYVRPSKTENTTNRGQLFKWTPERRFAWDLAIAARPALSPYVFCNGAGESYFDEERGTAEGFSSIWQRFIDRVLVETKVTERFAERDIRAKVSSDFETIERAQKVMGHADPKITKKHYRRKAEVIE